MSRLEVPCAARAAMSCSRVVGCAVVQVVCGKGVPAPSERCARGRVAVSTVDGVPPVASRPERAAAVGGCHGRTGADVLVAAGGP
jgi:hypothetical protein